jgi:hypothetical protein
VARTCPRSTGISARSRTRRKLFLVAEGSIVPVAAARAKRGCYWWVGGETEDAGRLKVARSLSRRSSPVPVEVALGRDIRGVRG